MKPMTFEEIWRGSDKISFNDETYIGKAIELARIGMIPEDEATEYQQIGYTRELDRGWSRIFEKDDTDGKGTFAVYIKKPKTPPWTPKVGDKVFVGSYRQVGVVEKIGYPLVVSGYKYNDKLELRPFDPDKIGEEW